MRPPSVGGIGIKLNTIRMALMIIPNILIKISGEVSIAMLSGNKLASLAISVQAMAMSKFAKGPAAATSIVSRLRFGKLLKLTGTGLAHPKAKPTVKIKTSGTRIVPIGSMCLSGFSVRRPIK